MNKPPARTAYWKEFQRLIRLPLLWLVFGLIFILALAGNVAASSLYGLLTSLSIHQAVNAFLFILCAAAFLGVSFRLYAMRLLFKTFHATLKLSESDQRKCLTFFISNDFYLIDADGCCLKAPDAEQVITLVASCPNDLNADADKLKDAKPTSPFEMILRGLAGHAGTVEKIYLIGSGKSVVNGQSREGTFDKLPLYKQLLGKYFNVSGRHVEIVPFEAPIDFEDAMEIHAALKKIIDDERRAGRRMEDFCIDVTAGQNWVYGQKRRIVAVRTDIGARLP